MLRRHVGEEVRVKGAPEETEVEAFERVYLDLQLLSDDGGVGHANVVFAHHSRLAIGAHALVTETGPAVHYLQSTTRDRECYST